MKVHTSTVASLSHINPKVKYEKETLLGPLYNLRHSFENPVLIQPLIAQEWNVEMRTPVVHNQHLLARIVHVGGEGEIRERLTHRTTDDEVILVQQGLLQPTFS